MPIPQEHTDAPAATVHWLSGDIVTPLNMYVFPWLWYGLLLGGIAYFTLHYGHLPDIRKMGIFGIAPLALTVFVVWLSGRIKRVGLADGQLVISNYRKTIYVPFRQVEAVEGVWWYWRRLVRIRLRPGEFGEVVYYIPKWAGLRWIVVDPARELREKIRDREALPPGYLR